MRRFFCQSLGVVGATISLPDDVAHHLRVVLRLEVGDAVQLFDGRGQLADGTVTRIADDGVDVKIESTRELEETGVAITLLQGIPKGDRWTALLEKSTELGVRRIVPVTTERTVVRVPSNKVENRLSRWRRIVEGAVRQSGRALTPTIEPPQSVMDALDHRHEAIQLIADLNSDVPIRDVVEPGTESVAIWIGPEGGFTDAELELVAQSATRVSLGEFTLRTDTAAIAAIVLARSASHAQ